MSLSPRPDEVHEDGRLGSELAAELERAREGVRGLDRGDDALGAAEQAQRLHGRGIRDGPVLGAPDGGQPRVLGADARVVEAGRDRVRLDRLAVLVLQEVAAGAVQYAGAALGDGRGVPLGVDALAAGLEAVEPDLGVVEEGVEDADRVGAAADAGRDRASAARPVRSSTCWRASSPMIFWKSRTISGNGCGPATVPKM